MKVAILFIIGAIIVFIGAALLFSEPSECSMQVNNQKYKCSYEGKTIKYDLIERADR